MTRLFGFTLLRNGIKYDYSFLESLHSLSGVCEKIFLALGKGEDGTEKALGEIPNLEIIPTVWDEKLREGAIILSQQTNVALEAAREKYKKVPASWGFYLQADEVLHQDDFQLIKEDLRKAEEAGADAVAFRYLHFWLGHRQLAINKKWYPQEIRAVKLDSKLSSWGDAQSFRPATKVFYSEARIFHYGHVREEESYKIKKQDILKLYHDEKKLSKYRRREKRFDKMTETLPYLGTHPKYMKQRILKLENFWQPSMAEKVILIGDKANFSPGLLEQIAAKEILWFKSPWQVKFKDWPSMVIPFPSWWQKLFFQSRVPHKMQSKLALPWSHDFILTLKLSERGIGINPV